ncbi:MULTISPECIES: type II toxin-antitoxin system VapC family toxin [Brenneria]|uniref:Type II toxin-antitoxin system VapC family toxin n=1 Tax=Brenneria nigrifluens DSM 30175 = ATCC 13028 TaxID=1121120 RepID=A0A2U1UQD4_9GAMM|nr:MULTISPECIES: type II toxin-antitoxin system VapC family toxin [Brenneria]EHD23601.1 PilT protein domain protein [Brenneria sp. EniD312]PWC23857.1 type II toxin-antitoxin system VapC family toxin [Brenneria nigrifluens DSM 30175 = ATCC 13028]QCR06528.1 type II toxin-antitoxin system VapC family toxin [Brenneria nigrifluens DSM 30175 = ATCC 13028]
MFMLDTNMVSHFFRQQPHVMAKMVVVNPAQISISCITEAELLYGVAKRQSKTLKAAVLAFLDAVTIYDWDSDAAACYGKLRATMEKKGKAMGTLDQLIAAHALSKRTTLVTNDHAFSMVPGLTIEDWTQ